jgi:hypothetical protein
MDRFNALGRGAQIMLVAGVLLFIDLFFNWQEITVDLGPLGEASNGVNAWDNVLGILVGLLTIVLLAWLVVRLMAVDIPIPVSQAMTAAVLGVLIFFFALVKNLADDYSTVWSWIGVGLAAIIVVGAYLEVQAAGGIDQLKSEVPAMGSSSTETSAAAPPPAEPTTVPAAPSEPVAPPPEAAAPPAEAPPADAPPTTEPAPDAPDDTEQRPA